MIKLLHSKITIFLALSLVSTLLIPAYAESIVEYHYHHHNYNYDPVFPPMHGYYVHHSYNGEIYYNRPYPPTDHGYPGQRPKIPYSSY